MTGGITPPSGRIFIVAGEESGDRHGADLVRAMLSRKPDLSFIGIGGERMAEAGVEIISPARKISVVGLVEVLEKAPHVLRAYLKARQSIKRAPLSAAIFIDFPDFNLRLARAAKKRGLPVFYYISPQVWAWRRKRVHSISRFVDRMLVILPFEEPFYREHGVEVEYVGHPLVGRIREFARGLGSTPGWEPECPVIGLMPGSREREVRAMLPAMLGAAEIIKKEVPGARLVLLLAGEVGEKTARRLIGNAALDVEIEKGPSLHVMARFNYLMVASGTATLEAGLLCIPMVIIYRGHLLSWLFTRPLIKVPHIGLPNLIAGKRVVPELRQYKATAELMAKQALKVLKDGEEYLRTKDNLARMARQLGDGPAAQKAAQAILSRLEV